jgi:hypothetical protein
LAGRVGAVSGSAPTFSAGPVFSAGAVARRLGVAVTTLRTWHQRYGLGPSVHVPGQHRRYTEHDIERLEAMHRLITEGVAPGEAARWARGTRLASLHRDGGGGLALGGAGRVARGLSRAALRLDATAVRERVAGAVRDLGVVGAWDSVLRPVLAAVGDRHVATGQLVDVEHLLSGCISGVLASVPRPGHGVRVRVMLACADEEQHTLPLEALAAALAVAGVPSRMLGGRVPATALISAVRRTGPAALLLWSHAPSTADPAQLRAVLDERSRPVLVAAAGPGWRPDDLPSGVAHPTTLADALALLTLT